MALPSQTDRSSEMGRSGASAGSKKGFDPVVVALGILVFAALAFGTFAVIRGKSATQPLPPTEITKAANPATAPANNAKPNTAIPPSTTPAKTSATPPLAAAPEIKQPDPLVVNQGGITTQPAAISTNAPNTSKPGPVDVTGGNTVAAIPTAAPGAQPIMPTASTTDVLSMIDAGDRENLRGNVLGARVILSKALLDTRTTAADHAVLRDKLTKINDDIMFGTKIVPGDTTIEEYKIVPGDRLANLPKKLQLPITWEVIARLNKIANPGALRIGQSLKIPRGPFHAVVSKSEFRADLYSGSPDEPDQWLFIRSFNVGLGENDGTPVGNFTVRNKMTNPSWVNPRTGQKFAADDPKNPIGERWVGLEGVGPSSQFKGLGLHGTIEPESIGQAKSMGCVRLADEDVKWVSEMLVEKISVVQIKQ